MKFSIIVLLCICQLVQFSTAQDPKDNNDDDDGQQEMYILVPQSVKPIRRGRRSANINFELD
uniref:Uncharacterized protein n=1 Tax=Romanomermis culicivorax TaxID=13658 RepID=A0A915HNB5_ROMCU